MSAPAIEIRDYGPPVRVALPMQRRRSRSRAASFALVSAVFAGGALMGALACGFVAGSSQPAAPATPGHHGYESGVAVGYAPTDDGAIAAAEGFVRLFGTPWVRSRTEIAAAFAVRGHPAAANALALTARSVYEATAAALLKADVDPGAVVVRVVPVSSTIVERSDTAVSVRVWTVTVDAVDGARAAEVRWGQTRVDLVWSEDDWRVLAVAREGDAPVPRPTGTPNVSTSTPPVLQDAEGLP